jgi:hypothetical protein
MTCVGPLALMQMPTSPRYTEIGQHNTEQWQLTGLQPCTAEVRGPAGAAVATSGGSSTGAIVGVVAGTVGATGK